MKIQMKRFVAAVLMGVMILSVLPVASVNAAESIEEETRETVGEESQGLNYVYINKSYVAEQENQDIMVSWGNEDQNIKHMMLQLEDENGKILLLEGNRYEANTVLFSSVLEKGIYHVTGLEVTTDATESVAMEEYGIHAAFGVGTEYLGEKSCYQSMESAESGTEVEYAVANLNGMDMEENAEQVAEVLSSVDTSSAVATMSLSDNEISTQSSSGQLVVVLDPGHDAKHVGARGNGVLEEVATFKIAQYCKAELQKYNGIEVRLTRDDAACPFPESTDNIDDIRKRVEWAKSIGADVFVSIHLNALEGSAAHGAEVYYPSQSGEGKELAQKIQDQLLKLGLYDRKIKAEDAYAVVNTSMANGFPGLIVEHAFLTNASDASNYLQTEEGLQKLGIADATGIATYYGLSKGYWVKTDGKWYYCNEYGVKQTGWKYINRAWYWLASDGVMQTGWCYINGQWYWFNADGEMQTGWRYINNQWYWLTSSGAMQTGWCYIDKIWYWFNADGEMQTGWLTQGNSKYYLMSSGAGATGWQVIGGKTYYFDSNCYMLTGTQIIDGTKYEFDRVSGELLKTYIQGWSYENEKWYYYDENENRIVGWSYINNEWYWFADDGEMQTDWQYINKKWYWFNNGGAMQTKWGYIDGEWYWFDENGVLQSGWLLLDGNWFYLQSSGAGAVGWKTIGGKTYYFDSNCYMLTGTQTIDGTKYEFDRVSGELLKSYIQGWTYENENWYYYDEKGTRIVGWKYINNVWYWFNSSGAMQTGWKRIDEKWYYFNEDGYWIKQDPVEGTYLIENVSAVTVEQMVNYYNASGKEYPEAALTIGGAKDITTFCRIYLEEAESEGIAVEVAFAQAMKETNWLHFGGDVKIEQFNFAGLGAIGGGVTGLDFSSYGEDGVRMGIRAHIQHLKAYASSEITENTLKNPCVDSRFKYVTKGCAKYVEWLGQKENPDSYGWATETKYGISIVGMINKMKQF